MTDEERKYPCIECGVLRSKAEGGTVFTVCDACWDKDHAHATSGIESEAVVDEDPVRIQSLREALKKYGRHTRDCQTTIMNWARGNGDEYPCTCGFAEALE